MIQAAFDYLIAMAQGRSGKWPAKRRAWLADHPMCACCGRTESLTVHHIKPFHLFPQFELLEDNFITLCEYSTMNCHLWFGHFGSFAKYYNIEVIKDVAKFNKMLTDGTLKFRGSSPYSEFTDTWEGF